MRVLRVRFTHRAESDLAEIAEYTAQNWGLAQANLYVDELESCCRALAENPALGRQCNDIRPGLRRMEAGRHVIFFREQGKRILVVRILHQRMLPDHHDLA